MNQYYVRGVGNHGYTGCFMFRERIHIECYKNLNALCMFEWNYLGNNLAIIRIKISYYLLLSPHQQVRFNDLLIIYLFLFFNKSTKCLIAPDYS